MNRTMTRTMTRCLPLSAALVAIVFGGTAVAGETGDAEGCGRQFEVAQRMDMESFRDYDAETFRAGHDDRAVSIFASGAAFYGIDAIMQVLASHFANREAQWSWVEKYRVVDGCKSAYILYETVYAIPRVGFRQRALTGVGYTHKGDHWVAVSDQGTLLPP